jgi:hypothetical protein
VRARANRQDEADVKLTRWPHKTFVLVSALAVVLAGGGGLVAGSFLRGPDEQTLTNSLRAVEVTAKVETRELQLDPFQGSLAAGSTTVLPAAAAPGASIPVATSSPKNIGDAVTSGDMLVAMNGDPVFALSLTVPMYRDLQMDAEGVDVLSLNQALKDAGILTGSVDDKYSYKTRIAVDKLFKRAKFVATGTLGGEALAARSIFDLPAEPVTVTQKAPADTALEVGTPVVTMSTAVDQLNVRVDSVSKTYLTVGGSATLRSQTSPDTRSATIVAISEFRDVAEETGGTISDGSAESIDANDAGASFPGYDVNLAIDFGADGNPWTSGDTLVVDFDVATATSAAVPLTAIREDAGATSVFVRSGSDANGTDEYEKVPVTVTDQSDGWALLAASDSIAVGDTIRVNP